MRIHFRYMLLTLLATACASAPAIPSGSQSVTLSVQNLECLECGKELEERTAKQPGVRSVHFDEKKIELNLEVAPGTSPQAIIAALQAEPIDGRAITVVLGAGHGRFAPFQPLKPGWDAKVLSEHGEDVGGFEPTLGRVTVVDFFADWCGPCHEIDAVMHGLLEQSAAQLAYRRLNVVDWDSPLAKHFLSGVSALPYVVVLDRRGKEIARLAGFKPEELRAAIAKGESR